MERPIFIDLIFETKSYTTLLAVRIFRESPYFSLATILCQLIAECTQLVFIYIVSANCHSVY